MNKTIIININGIVFHIEEDAYEVLKQYMTDVKRHFLNSADSHEITTDIENRIAEMFSEILTAQNKQVIVEQDVKNVIEQMGTVEDFEHAEDDAPATAGNTYNYGNTSTRTLFRDPDDHLIAGVCSGLANYFDIQAIWIRLAFAFAVVFGGTGFILYIILWVVIPRAITRGDRMAMKGQKLNLQGFKDNFEEELKSVRNHFSNLHAEARPLVYKFRDFLGEFFFHVGQFFNGAGKVLIKLVGIAIMLACLAAMVFLVVCLGLLTVAGKPSAHMFPFSLMSNQYASRIYIAGFIVAIIPVLAIFLLTIKATFNTRSIDRSVATIIFIAWLFAVGVLVFYGSKVAAGFRSSASFNQTLTLKATPNNTYYLKLNDVKYFSHDDSLRLDIKSNFKNMVVTTDNDNDNFEPDNVSIRIEKSDVSQPVLVETFHSQGSHYEDALLNARNTTYRFVQQDSVLSFDRFLERNAGTSWYGQEIELTLKVPMNSTLVIDSKLDRFLRNGIDIGNCKDMNKHPDAPNATFTMTVDGPACKVDTLVTAPVKTDSVKTTKPVKVK